jgi:hypothetical protein
MILSIPLGVQVGLPRHSVKDGEGRLIRESFVIGVSFPGMMSSIALGVAAW